MWIELALELTLEGLASAGKGLLYTGFPHSLTDGYAMLMTPSKGVTAVHGCHCPRDMAVRMREVMTRLWVGVCMPLALIYWQLIIHLPVHVVVELLCGSHVACVELALDRLL